MSVELEKLWRDLGFAQVWNHPEAGIGSFRPAACFENELLSERGSWAFEASSAVLC